MFVAQNRAPTFRFGSLHVTLRVATTQATLDEVRDAENANLRRMNADLRVQVQRLLKINAALSNEMVRQHKSSLN